MTHCPYPETIKAQASDKTEPNILYLVWHEGYEAHKFEIANLSIQLACLTVELDTKIRNVQELKSELEKQRTKLQKVD